MTCFIWSISWFLDRRHTSSHRLEVWIIQWCECVRLRIILFTWIVLNFQRFISILESDRWCINTFVHLLRLENITFSLVIRRSGRIMACVSLQMLHESLLRCWSFGYMFIWIFSDRDIVRVENRLLTQVFHRRHVLTVSSCRFKLRKCRQLLIAHPLLLSYQPFLSLGKHFITLLKCLLIFLRFFQIHCTVNLFIPFIIEIPRH